MDKINDFESAPARQNKVITNAKKIPLAEGQPRDMKIVYMTPLMRIGNPQSTGQGRVQALNPDTQRHHA